MNRAVCFIREALIYRRTAFISGLEAAGYAIVSHLPKPDAGDVLVIWNRYGNGEEHAQLFERAGAKVVVVENGYLGKSWLGDRWFALSLSQHNGAGEWFPGGPMRWDDMQIPLAPWRNGGKETLILAQRGIGSSEVRSPDGWAERTAKRLASVPHVRIRPHPGKYPPTVALGEDLKDASSVITWASSAALQALILGVPVWYDFPKWIGAQAAKPFSCFGEEPNRSDDFRLAMFRKLVWAMWRVGEVENGLAFEHLLRR